jgi:hypothetical protein
MPDGFCPRLIVIQWVSVVDVGHFSGSSLWILLSTELSVSERGFKRVKGSKTVVFENGLGFKEIHNDLFSNTGLKFVRIPRIC